MNIQPTLRNSGQEETETCLRWPLLSFLCFFFAGSPPLLTAQYYILNQTVPSGSLAIHYYTITLPTSWSSQTAPSNGLLALFLAVIIANIKTPTLRKPINFMIVNMAIPDLLIPIFLFPLSLVEMQVDNWLISEILYQTLCKTGFFLLTVSATVSIQSLILIRVDRFGAVVKPIRGSPLISRRLCLFFIVVTWIVAVAANLPHFFAFKRVEHPGGMVMCLIQKSSASYYLLAYFVAFFYIPFVLLIILYAIILIKLKQHAHPGEQSAIAKEMRTKRNRNVLKMVIVIVFVFFLCWIPYITNRTILHFAPNSSIWFSCNFLLYDVFTSFMAAANCAVNPIICLIFSSNYRQGLLRLSTKSNTKSNKSFKKDLLLFVLNFREVLLIWVNRVNSYNPFLIC